MGRINIIYDPKKWKISLMGESRLIKGDVIYEVVIGESIDYQYCEIRELMSKYNYENIVSGNYSIKTFPYSEIPILIFNENKELVPLVRGRFIDHNRLTESQIEYIHNIYGIKKVLK